MKNNKSVHVKFNFITFSRSASRGKRIKRVNATNQPNLVTSINANPSDLAMTNIFIIGGVGLGLNLFRSRLGPDDFKVV